MFLPLMFALLVSANLPLQAAESPSTCSQRALSLTQTSKLKLQSPEGWEISAKNSAGQISCSASLVLSTGDGGTLIFVPSGQYQGGKWFFSFSSQKNKLPRDFEGPAQLFVDGKNVHTGKIFETGASVGGKRTSSFVCAEFPKLDSVVARLSQANQIEIQTKIKNWGSLKVPTLSSVIGALEDCAKKATGSESQVFWENSQQECR